LKEAKILLKKIIFREEKTNEKHVNEARNNSDCYKFGSKADHFNQNNFEQIMLSKLISKAKQEKKQASQQKEDKEPNTDSAQSKNKDELEKEYLNLRAKNYNDLTPFKVSSVDTIYYIPNYITEEDEKYLLNQIYSQPQENWHQLKHAKRRLQKWGGEVTKNGLENNEPLPTWLEKFSELLCKENITAKKTNHVLLNEYHPGVGIMPHTDGPLYHPYVVILSLGSHTCFEFYKDYPSYKEEDILTKLLIEPRSLLIFKDDAYDKFLHSIADRDVDFIDLDYSFDKENKTIKINNSNVANFHLTNLFNKFKEQASLKSEEEIEGKSFNETWKLIREKRISLTIRYVPTSS